MNCDDHFSTVNIFRLLRINPSFQPTLALAPVTATVDSSIQKIVIRLILMASLLSA
jgi:hypothetical protein